MSHGYYTCANMHISCFHLRKFSTVEKTLPANLLSNDRSELDFSMQVEKIPQQQQAENVAPGRDTQGENGTDSRIPVCYYCHYGGNTEAEKTSCLFCNRTSPAIKLFQDAHHTNVTPWNSKVHHRRVQTLFGRDCWWSSNPTSWSVWGCRLNPPQL